jgi:sugar lactone lactonase YvrE
MRAVGRDPMVLLSSDYPVVVGADGALYFAEPRADRRLEIVRLLPGGERGVLVTLPAESDGGAVRWLNGIAAAADASIYYAENAAVRRIDSRGEIATIASRIEVPDCEPMPHAEAHLGPYLRGLAVAQDGTVYVAATGCSAVLRILPGGETAVVLRATPPWAPTAVAVSGGDVFVLEYTHDAPGDDRRDWVPRVRKLQADGTVTLIVEVER